MGPRSDSSLAAALLAQRVVEAGAPPFKAAEYWALVERVGDPAALLGCIADDVCSTFEVGPEEAQRVVALLDAASAFAFELDRLEQSGVRVVTSVDDEYPEALRKLGRSAPPQLYAAGDVGLLHRSLIGVVGSRAVGESDGELAKAVAREAVGHGFGVVSGGAKGVDRLAMTAAIDAGGAAVGALADSLLRTVRDADVRRAVTDGAACLFTPYKPSAGFSVANAMARNKLIYALSEATFVVACEAEKGGTWAGAVEALRQHTAPVLTWTGPDATPGNGALVAAGAVGVESVDEIVALARSAPGPVPAPAETGGGPPPQHQLALEV
jgi:predicted Rossmann fold nucleotide-binding protein DprA/Smf involved in DNA uptake